MKFTINKSKLLKSLKSASRITGTRTSLPILSHVLLKADTDTVTISATNLECDMVCEIPAEVETDGSICVPLSALVNAVEPAVEPEISIELDKTRVNIRGGKYKIPFMPAADFVPIKAPKSGGHTIPASVIHAGIKAVAWAQSTDESRYVLNAVLLTKEDGKLRFVAVDGRCMGLLDTAAEYGGMDGLLPSNFVAILQSALPDGKADAAMAMDENRVTFSAQDDDTSIVLGCKLVEGNYVAYKQVISSTPPKQVVPFSPEVLIEKIRAVSRFTDDKDCRVKLMIEKNLATLSAKTDVGEATEEVDVKCSGYVGFAFDPKYLLPMISAVGENDSADLWYWDELTPIQIVSGPFMGILVPMRLS